MLDFSLYLGSPLLYVVTDRKTEVCENWPEQDEELRASRTHGWLWNSSELVFGGFPHHGQTRRCSHLGYWNFLPLSWSWKNHEGPIERLIMSHWSLLTRDLNSPAKGLFSNPVPSFFKGQSNTVGWNIQMGKKNHETTVLTEWLKVLCFEFHSQV